MAGSSARISDQITEPFPDPVAPAISTCVAASRSRHGDPSSHRPTGSPARSTSPAIGSAGIGSARVSARTSSSTSTPGRQVADPAQPRAERVRQVLALVGEVGGSLPGHQADPHQVHRPGPVHSIQDREHRLAPVVRGEPGQGHGGLPAAPVEPPPPPVPHRHRHEPREPLRLDHPQPGQGRHSRQRQASDAGPAQAQPDDHDQRRDGIQQRVGEGEPQHPPHEPEQLDDEDDRLRCAVHGGPPHRGRERIAVVDLGELLARHDVTAARH